MNNFELIMALNDTLSRIKGFDCGYTTDNKNEMIIDYNGKRCVMSLKEVENPSEDIFDDIDKYL